MMNQLDLLWRSAERHPDPLTFRALADHLEEQGAEPDLAFAFRWAAFRGLYPEVALGRRGSLGDCGGSTGLPERKPVQPACVTLPFRPPPPSEASPSLISGGVSILDLFPGNCADAVDLLAIPLDEQDLVRLPRES